MSTDGENSALSFLPSLCSTKSEDLIMQHYYIINTGYTDGSSKTKAEADGESTSRAIGSLPSFSFPLSADDGNV